MTKFCSTWHVVYRYILAALATYFFLMGAFLIIFPQLLLEKLGQPVTPAVVGILRGAGGATIPYTLLYILLAAKPAKCHWAGYVILLANGLAIILDLNSLFLAEYTIMQSLIDLPVEIMSLVVILAFSRGGNSA
jgi:hypothetical protein